MQLLSWASRWLNRLTLGWSLGTRLLVITLAPQIACAFASLGLGVLIQTGAISGHPFGWQIERPPIQLGLVILGSLLTAVAVVLASKWVARSINEVARLVDDQISTDDVDIALKQEREDEIGQLILSLNRLGQRYRTTLQNLARRIDELAMLERLAETISRTLDLQQVLDLSLGEALKALKYDLGAIFMWDERDDSLNMVSFQGLDEETVRANISLHMGEGLAGVCARRREVIVKDEADFRIVVRDRGIRSVTQMAVPLVSIPGQLEGVLLIGNMQSKTLSPDELSLLLTVAHHISLAIARAQLYSKVNQYALELEKQVAARTQQLSDAIDELWTALKQAQEADRVKSLLLSTVSHELRTPLATIKGNTSLLIEHHSRLNRKQLREHLQDIEEETDRLTELISNLLDMSRLDAGMLQVEIGPLDAVSLVQGVVSAARMRLPDHQIEFVAGNRPYRVLGDPRRITQILDNLLDNAVRYSPAGKPVHIALAEANNELVISVTDQGIGIPEEHLGRIFDRFYQVKSGSDSGRHGIGLGLAICRGLVEAQGGRIWAKSTPGQGSTFHFTLKMPPEMRRKGSRT